MRLFICWSEHRSRELADELATWLPKVLGPELSCSVSTKFEVGEQWFPQLLRELDAADAAIVCLTPENLASRWLHFEAGMLFRSGAERVLPYFLGSEVPAIDEPLNVIQASAATEAGTRGLVQALARRGAQSSSDVQRRFDACWPDLGRFIRRLAAPRFDDVFPGFAALFERKTFSEPIEECTDQGWVARYDGARETLLAIRQRSDVIDRCCQPWQVWLYRKLLGHIDGYARDIAETLLAERRFDVGEADRIDFARPIKSAAPPPAGRFAATCARRCREIRHVVFCLTRSDGAPRLAQSLAFAKMSRDQFDDKKRLVQSTGSPVDRAGLGLQANVDLESCVRSPWDFDRIVYYRVCLDEPVAPDAMTRLVEHELHQAEAEGPDASKMPLHYAVKVWLSALEKGAAFDARQTVRVVAGVLAFLDRTRTPLDDDPKIRSHLAGIDAIVGSRGPVASGAVG